MSTMRTDSERALTPGEIRKNHVETTLSLAFLAESTKSAETLEHIARFMKAREDFDFQNNMLAFRVLGRLAGEFPTSKSKEGEPAKERLLKWFTDYVDAHPLHIHNAAMAFANIGATYPALRETIAHTLTNLGDRNFADKRAVTADALFRAAFTICDSFTDKATILDRRANCLNFTEDRDSKTGFRVFSSHRDTAIQEINSAYADLGIKKSVPVGKTPLDPNWAIPKIDSIVERLKETADKLRAATVQEAELQTSVKTAKTEDERNRIQVQLEAAQKSRSAIERSQLNMVHDATFQARFNVGRFESQTAQFEKIQSAISESMGGEMRDLAAGQVLRAKFDTISGQSSLHAPDILKYVERALPYKAAADAGTLRTGWPESKAAINTTIADYLAIAVERGTSSLRDIHDVHRAAFGEQPTFARRQGGEMILKAA